MGGEDRGGRERQATDWPSAANHADGIHREKLDPWVVEKLKKLNQARSRLYRNQILQENTRLKALAEIYTMHSFASFSNIHFFVKHC